MKYPPIDPSLFIANRAKLTASLKSNSLVILHSNDIPATNADGSLRLIQNSDLFYLSGIDQEESILIIFPDAKDEKQREMLFVRETSELIAVWEGEKLTKEQATEVSGIRTVHWLQEFPQIFRVLMCQAEHVYLNSNEHPRAQVATETRDTRFVRACMREYPLHQYERLARILGPLRQVKHEIEIALIRKACEITEKGFRRVLNFVKPGVTEYEIEAEFAHEFLRNRSNRFSYTPIIASGAGSCVLHYLENDKPCHDGDVILLDVGAEYSNYAADMTRTIPVNGRFTERQRAVYEAVLRVLREAMSLLKPGVVIKDYQENVGRLVESELIQLGLLNREEVEKQDPDKPLYKKYFMHGTAHHLGLDVHDVGDTFRPLEPGMVLTCEPGIYIRDEKLGVRLENDVLITEDGNIDLMANIPLDPDEIEELMCSGRS